MTKVIKFKCVVCGNPLGEEQYYIAYEELRNVANHIAKKMLQEHISELEVEHLNEIQGAKQI